MVGFEDDEFATGDSGASSSFPKQCSALRKNGNVIMKDRPCKILEMLSSKTGKHGSVKIHMTAVDIFTSKKYEEIFPSTQTVSVPIVHNKLYELMSIEDGYLIMMGSDLNLIEDVALPSTPIGKEIQEKFNAKGESEILQVLVVSAMGEKQAQGCRLSTDK